MREGEPTPVPETVVDADAWHDLKRLDERGEGLTQWEIDFVEDLHGYLRAGRRLSAKQRMKLDAMLEDRLP